MLVDVAQGDVIEARISDQALTQHQLVTKHDLALAAQPRAMDAGVGSQNERQRRIDLVRQRLLEGTLDAIVDVVIDLVKRLAGRIQVGHEATARHPRQRQYLHRHAQFGRRPQLQIVGHKDTRHGQRGELL